MRAKDGLMTVLLFVTATFTLGADETPHKANAQMLLRYIPSKTVTRFGT